MQRPRLVRIDFNPQELADLLQRGVQPTVVLDPDTAHHIVRVLRLAVGAPLIAATKSGGASFHALLVDRDPATIQIIRHSANERWIGRVSVLIVGAIRGNRLDWICEKATELCLEQLWVVQSARSEPHALSPQRQNRLERLAGAATEQSTNLNPPSIRFFESLEAVLLELKDHAGVRSLMSLAPHAEPMRQLKIGADDSLIIAVGPEGDFDDRELHLLLGAGFTPTSLGPVVLRVETAALASIAAANALWGFRQLSSAPIS